MNEEHHLAAFCQNEAHYYHVVSAECVENAKISPRRGYYWLVEAVNYQRMAASEYAKARRLMGLEGAE